MATKATKKTTKPPRKFIKVDDEDHAFIKIQAAKRRRTMGEYIVGLARADSKVK